MKLFGKEIGRDKLLHFVSGFILGILGICITLIFTSKIILLTFFGIALPTFVGILKELRDSYGAGQVEMLDAAFTIFGGMLATILILLFILL